jgi:hypothetical protein
MGHFNFSQSSRNARGAALGWCPVLDHTRDSLATPHHSRKRRWTFNDRLGHWGFIEAGRMKRGTIRLDESPSPMADTSHMSIAADNGLGIVAAMSGHDRVLDSQLLGDGLFWPNDVH